VLRQLCVLAAPRAEAVQDSGGRLEDTAQMIPVNRADEVAGAVRLAWPPSFPVLLTRLGGLGGVDGVDGTGGLDGVGGVGGQGLRSVGVVGAGWAPTRRQPKRNGAFPRPTFGARGRKSASVFQRAVHFGAESLEKIEGRLIARGREEK